MPGLRSFEQERAPNGQFGPGDGSGSSAGWNGQGVAPSLDAFSKHWEDQGLRVAVYQKSGNGPIVLSQVVVPKDQRSQGIGSKFMGGLTKYADAHGLAIHPSPSKDFGGTVSRLTDFYKSHGFVENKGRNKDYEVSESMYRLPQGQTASGLRPFEQERAPNGQFGPGDGSSKSGSHTDGDALVLTGDHQMYRVVSAGNEFDPNHVADRGESGAGVYLTPNKEFAQRMLKGGAGDRELYTVTVHAGDGLRLLDRATPAGEARYRELQRDPVTARTLTGKDQIAAFKAAGYDGVKLPEQRQGS